MQISTKEEPSSDLASRIAEPVASTSPESREVNNGALKIKERPMKRMVRTLLIRTLSPKTFQVLRYWSWCLRSYIPRLFTSKIVSRNPEVRYFGASSSSSDLEKQLKSVNALAPTKMCRVMTKYGSDKGRSHRYTTVYSALFKEQYDKPLRILELGLGSNNLDVPSNMGVFGAPGASLRGWRELLPHAQIYGADIDRRILFKEDRIATFPCNQLDATSVRALWSNPGLKDGADIIIEDGLHTFEANVAFLQESLPHLRPGGIYITEDIMSDDADKWYEFLGNTCTKQYPKHEFTFLTLPGKYESSSNLVVIRRAAE